MFRHILVPLDGSEYAERSLKLAAELATTHQASLTLLSVLLRPDSPQIPHVPKLDAQSEERARVYLQARADTARAAGAANVSSEVLFGEAAAAIADFAAANGVDLIAMSTHGLGASGRYALGSVALKVLMTAPCPVLLVRIEEFAERR
jgi:nucleotide-binding universal stress UspA family protein